MLKVIYCKDGINVSDFELDELADTLVDDMEIKVTNMMFIDEVRARYREKKYKFPVEIWWGEENSNMDEEGRIEYWPDAMPDHNSIYNRLFD